MSIKNLNKIQKILYFLVLFFPLIIIFRSAAINITLIILSFISIIYIVAKKDHFFFEDNLIKF